MRAPSSRRLLHLAELAVLALVVATVSAVLASRFSGGGVPVPTAVPPSRAFAASLGITSPEIRTSVDPSGGVGLPRHDLTPGAVDPDATQENLAATVCKTGWAATQRPPAAYTSALKLAQVLEYGYSDRTPGHYQEDHLVPLELGGAPRDRHNLWPEPNSFVAADGTAMRSTDKDDLEDSLHALVCAGSVPLADAQRMIADNWLAAWRQYVHPG